MSLFTYPYMIISPLITISKLREIPSDLITTLCLLLLSCCFLLLFPLVCFFFFFGLFNSKQHADCLTSRVCAFALTVRFVLRVYHQHFKVLNITVCFETL